jgi:hypothetical protein
MEAFRSTRSDSERLFEQAISRKSAVLDRYRASAAQTVHPEKPIRTKSSPHETEGSKRWINLQEAARALAGSGPTTPGFILGTTGDNRLKCITDRTN